MFHRETTKTKKQHLPRPERALLRRRLPDDEHARHLHPAGDVLSQRPGEIRINSESERE